MKNAISSFKTGLKHQDGRFEQERGRRTEQKALDTSRVPAKDENISAYDRKNANLAVINSTAVITQAYLAAVGVDTTGAAACNFM